MTHLKRFALWRSGARSTVVQAGDGTDFGRVDGLVIGGGDDISPTLYDGDLALVERIDPDRDTLELRAMEAMARRGRPILGICRGSQIINVFFGGSLNQDIYASDPGIPRLRTVWPRKIVHVEPETRLRRAVGCADCRVNSLHHQAVARLGTGLRVSARDGHGIIQAIERSDGPFLIGVQWHPEMLAFDPNQVNLFASLVRGERR